jgi:hypothetical protein
MGEQETIGVCQPEGERILGEGGHPMQALHEEVLRQKKLPDVGQTVRSKKYGTLWRVMEKREVWQDIADDPETGDPRLVPAIYLAYWRIRKGVRPGIGKMLGYAYTLYDNTFESNWDIVGEESEGRFYAEIGERYPRESRTI